MGEKAKERAGDEVMHRLREMFEALMRRPSPGRILSVVEQLDDEAAASATDHKLRRRH